MTTTPSGRSTRTALERAGFSVLLASSGRPVLELVRGNPVEVLLLDLSMPGMDGLATDDGVRPDVRLAEATRLGLGRALERATLASAIDAVAALPTTLALSIKVSPDVLQNETSLPEIVARARRPVIVELTEHERIDDYAAIRAGFARLGPAVRLAVDGAGSGYASLKHILSLQPSYVKLDMEWVRGIDRDPARRSLVSGLAYFAQATGSELIAEGVESEDERAALVRLGVTLGQGFLFGRPAPTGSLVPAVLRDHPESTA